MTSKKSAKRELLSSVMALLICIAMFSGTTYAWFTDSVTSGVNRIVAGNLDVKLYHSNKTVTDEEVGRINIALHRHRPLGARSNGLRELYS